MIDCIPALLRARGLQLVPLSERVLQAGDPFAAHPEIEAVLVANPNNPTGTVLSAPALERLARACAERGAPLVIDQCFRAFDPRAQYDTYALLDGTGVEYVIVEDTGKLWPTAGRQARPPGVVGERPPRPGGGGGRRPADGTPRSRLSSSSSSPSTWRPVVWTSCTSA